MVGTFPSPDKKGYLSWKDDWVVVGTVLRLDLEVLAARIPAAGRSSGVQSWRIFCTTVLRDSPSAQQ